MPLENRYGFSTEILFSKKQAILLILATRPTFPMIFNDSRSTNGVTPFLRFPFVDREKLARCLYFSPSSIMKNLRNFIDDGRGRGLRIKWKFSIAVSSTM